MAELPTLRAEAEHNAALGWAGQQAGQQHGLQVTQSQGMSHTVCPTGHREGNSLSKAAPQLEKVLDGATWACQAGAGSSSMLPPAVFCRAQSPSGRQAQYIQQRQQQGP